MLNLIFMVTHKVTKFSSAVIVAVLLHFSPFSTD